MAITGLSRQPARDNPLDLIEQVVHAHDWTFDRCNEQELSAQAPGRWCDYSLYFAWNAEVGAVHFTCAFDMRVPAERRQPVYELLALINEKTWLGHFSVWDRDGLPMFRHALPLRGLDGPSIEQIEDLVETGVMECDRFYPAFQYVIWGGKSPREAVDAAMIETVGEA